jgi:hypothetical protein
VVLYKAKFCNSKSEFTELILVLIASVSAAKLNCDRTADPK